MVVRISGNSERSIGKAAPNDPRFESRMADGGWVVFDNQLRRIAVIEGLRLERLKEGRALVLVEELNSREKPKQ